MQDGGWYSYPALALSRGDHPGEARQLYDSIGSVQGLKAQYIFNTFHSIRIFYTALWMRYLSPNIFSIKILSFLELITFFVFAYLLIYRFSQDKLISLMLLSLLINDKRLLVVAASNYRPDVILAALSCLTFLLLLQENRPIALILGIFVSCLMLLTHITSVIPFSCIISFFVFRNFLNGKYKLRDNYGYLLVAIIGIFVFFNGHRFFNTLFPFSGELLSSPLSARNKVFSGWETGPMYIFGKELSRWKGYFFTSNFAQLLVFLTATILFLRKLISFPVRDKTEASLALSILTGLTMLAVFDPHPTHTHSIPMVFFFFLLLAHTTSSFKWNHAVLNYVLVGLVFFTSLLSIALAGKTIVQGQRSGFNIIKITKSFEKILDNKDQQYRLIGPTEIWPFLKHERNVLIIDTTRSTKELSALSPIIDSVDYVVTNEDYERFNWETAFLEHFPSLYFETITNVGNKEQFIKIARLIKKSAK